MYKYINKKYMRHKCSMYISCFVHVYELDMYVYVAHTFFLTFP